MARGRERRRPVARESEERGSDQEGRGGGRARRAALFSGVRRSALDPAHPCSVCLSGSRESYATLGR